MKTLITQIRGHIASENPRTALQLRKAQIERSESYFTRTVSLTKASTPQMKRGSGILAAMCPRIWVITVLFLFVFPKLVWGAKGENNEIPAGLGIAHPARNGSSNPSGYIYNSSLLLDLIINGSSSALSNTNGYGAELLLGDGKDIGGGVGLSNSGDRTYLIGGLAFGAGDFVLGADVSHQIADNSATAGISSSSTSIDAGLLINPEKKTKVGIIVNNVNSGITSLALGVAFELSKKMIFEADVFSTTSGGLTDDITLTGGLLLLLNKISLAASYTFYIIDPTPDSSTSQLTFLGFIRASQSLGIIGGYLISRTSSQFSSTSSNSFSIGVRIAL